MIFLKDWALISAKESEHYSVHLYQKAKTPITLTRPKGLGYVSTLVSLDPEPEEEVYRDNLSAISSWNSDISVGNIFKSLSVNMVSSSHLEDDRENTFKSKELIQSDSNPWIKHLNNLWNIRFEQRKPPTEDKVTQVNLKDEANPFHK